MITEPRYHFKHLDDPVEAIVQASGLIRNLLHSDPPKDTRDGVLQELSEYLLDAYVRLKLDGA